MLQIATGRFFTKPESVLEHSGTGILYSNLTWPSEIETSAGTLVPVDWLGAGPRPWVVRYTNRMESERRPGGLVRVGDAEIVEQVQLLCMLGLNAFFHVARDIVEHTCRARSAGQHDRSPPSMFVTRILQPQINGTPEDVERLKGFIHNTLRLPRVRYRALIACTRAMCDSLIVASYNLHLAYSMLVYALESLSQQFDGHAVKWEHLDETVRRDLETIFEQAPQAVTAAIRKALMKTAHVKLGSRFATFVEEHVREPFFRSECSSTTNALRKSDLSRALRTAYETRSGFVHRLEPIREQICVPSIAQGDVFEWERRPYLTYRGLMRLVQHVLHSFVARGPFLDKEDYPWRGEVPGIITLKIAPQHWIWQVEGFSSAAAPYVLGGFLEHLNEVIDTNGSIADMREVVARCIELIPTAKLHEKRAMLLIVVLFNFHVREEGRMEDWMAFADAHMSVLDGGCIEALLLDLYLGRRSDPPGNDCARCVESFLERRHHKTTLGIPDVQRTALMLSVYNRFLGEGNVTDAGTWAHRAILDEAGAPQVQAAIEQAVVKGEPIALSAIMWKRNTAARVGGPQ